MDAARGDVATGSVSGDDGKAGVGLPSATDDQFGAVHDFPRFAGAPRVYLIASIPRSGSHYLSELLRQCGDLGSPFEYLNPGRRQQWLDSTGASDLAEMLDRLMQRRTSPSGWFGCKTHWHAFEEAIADPRVAQRLGARHYIHIRRRDTLGQAISQVIAGQTRSWRSFQQPVGEPTYDRSAIADVEDDFKRQEAYWQAYFAAQSVEPVTIDYEDLVAGPQSCIDAIRESLGLPPRSVRPAETRLKRQATGLNEEWRSRYLAGA